MICDLCGRWTENWHTLSDYFDGREFIVGDDCDHTPKDQRQLRNYLLAPDRDCS